MKTIMQVYGLSAVEFEEIKKSWISEYSANGRPLVTVEKSTQYADQVHLAQKLNTLKSPLWIWKKA